MLTWSGGTEMNWLKPGVWDRYVVAIQIIFVMGPRAVHGCTQSSSFWNLRNPAFQQPSSAPTTWSINSAIDWKEVRLTNTSIKPHGDHRWPVKKGSTEDSKVQQLLVRSCENMWELYSLKPHASRWVHAASMLLHHSEYVRKIPKALAELNKIQASSIWSPWALELQPQPQSRSSWHS